MNERTAVYRLYDSNGVLLYVGISRNPDVRWGQHSTTKSWWPDVAERKVAWCDSREDARVAELAAIRHSAPRYNEADRTPPKGSTWRQLKLPTLRPDRHRHGAKGLHCPDDLWQAAKDSAAAEQRTLRDVLMTFLRWYTGRTDEPPTRPRRRRRQPSDAE